MVSTLDDQYTISQAINAEVAAIQNILTEAAASGKLGMTAKEYALAQKELIGGKIAGAMGNKESIDNVIKGFKGFIQSDTFMDPDKMADADDAEVGNDFIIRPGGDLEKWFNIPNKSLDSWYNCLFQIMAAV